MTPNPRPEGMTRERVMRFALPVVALALGILVWDLVVRFKSIPPYVLPGPGLVFQTRAMRDFG